MAPNQQRYSNQERKIAGPKQENHPLASFFLHPPPVSSAKGQRFLSVDASTPRHTVKKHRITHPYNKNESQSAIYDKPQHSFSVVFLTSTDDN